VKTLALGVLEICRHQYSDSMVRHSFAVYFASVFLNTFRPARFRIIQDWRQRRSIDLEGRCLMERVGFANYTFDVFLKSFERKLARLRYLVIPRRNL
jgi:hypothetical protein